MGTFLSKDDKECFVCNAVCLSRVAQKCWARYFLWVLRGRERETRDRQCWLFAFKISLLCFTFSFPWQNDVCWPNAVKLFSLWRLCAAFACCVYVWVIHLIVHLNKMGARKKNEKASHFVVHCWLQSPVPGHSLCRVVIQDVIVLCLFFFFPSPLPSIKEPLCVADWDGVLQIGQMPKEGHHTRFCSHCWLAQHWFCIVRGLNTTKYRRLNGGETVCAHFVMLYVCAQLLL